MKQQDLKPRKGAARAGLRVLRRRIEIDGLAAIDKRTAGAQQFLYWREQIMNDLGGEENLSAQKKTLAELTAQKKLIRDHVAAYVLGLPTLVNRRKKSLLPIVLQLNQLTDSLEKSLERLGLDKQMKPLPTLAEYLEQKEAASDEETIPVEVEEAKENADETTS